MLFESVFFRDSGVKIVWIWLMCNLKSINHKPLSSDIIWKVLIKELVFNIDFVQNCGLKNL